MNPLKLALIAGGGYLLYRYYQMSQEPPSNTGATGTGPAGGTIPAGTNPATGTTGGSTTPTNNNTTTTGGGGGTSTTQTTIPMLMAQLYNNDAGVTPGVIAGTQYGSGREYVTAKGAAGDSAAIGVLDAAGVVYNVDQWNYFRALTGLPAIDSSSMDAIIGANDRGQEITASQYRARLAGAGLSGLSGIGNFNPTILDYAGVWY